MKIKIVQYLIGNLPDYIKISKLAEKINKKYCEIHNYEYKFDYLTNINYQDFTISSLYRFKYILDNLNDCDYLVLFDADAAVSNPNIKIKDLFNNDNIHELFLSHGNFRYDHIKRLYDLYQILQNLLINHKDLLYNKKYCEYYKQFNLYNYGEGLTQYDLIPLNEGLIIVKNTTLMKKFFKECEHIGQYFLNNINTEISPEGNALMFLLQQKKYCNTYCFLPTYAQQCNLGAFENKYDVDKAFVLHNYGRGLSFDLKYNNMNLLLTNKYWKNITF